MGYLPDFEHDIFISYAHVDNRPDREGEKGWVEQFADQLYTQLLKVTGKEVTVWRDPELQRAEKFDKVIEKAVRGSGMVLSLITNPYLESDYCAQEIAWFCDKARQEAAGLVVNDMPRVFPVLLYNLPFDSWPEICKGTSGHMFHDIDDPKTQKGLGRPLDPASERFRDPLRVLVDELVGFLTLLRERSAAAPVGESDTASTYRIFLAECADDMRRDRRLLMKELEREQISVMRLQPKPAGEAEHAKAVERMAADVDLSVHLLGSLPGAPLDEDSIDFAKTYPVEQARIAGERARSQLILLANEFRVEDIDEEFAAYKTFMQELIEGQRAEDRLQIVQTGWQRMVEEVLARKRRLEEHTQREQDRAAGSAGTVFIDIHANDLQQSSPLVAYLAEKNLTPVMVPSTDRPAAGMTAFEDNLKKSRLCIVVYGGVAAQWVKERVKEAAKLILSDDLPTHVGVYVAPPEKPSEALQFPGLVTVMNNMMGFQPQTLDAVLASATGSA